MVIVIAILAAAGIVMYARSLEKVRASREVLAILSSVRTHYLLELIENGAPPEGSGTLNDDWGIDTTKNKWWTEGTGFGTDWDDYQSRDSYH